MLKNYFECNTDFETYNLYLDIKPEHIHQLLGLDIKNKVLLRLATQRVSLDN